MNTPPCTQALPPSDLASEAQGAGVPPPAADRLIGSDDLLQGRSCVLIRHGDALYALRATRSGKLILTK